MLVWITQDGEPLPGIDPGARDWRCGLLAKILAGQGHEVFWWAATFDHTRKQHWFNEARTVEIMPGLKIRLLHGPGYRYNKSPKRLWHYRVLGRAFATESMAAHRPDVIFASWPTPELVEQAIVYGQKAGVPVLIDIRDLWPDHYLTLVRPQLQGLLRLALFSEFQRAQRSLKRATGITAISQTFLNWGLKYAQRQQGDTDGVFPMGYPAALLPEPEILARQEELISQYGLKPERLIIAFVGSLNSIFDFQTVIEAAQRLEQSHNSDVQFVMVGDGESGPQMRAQAQGLSNVIFTGWVDQTGVAAVLNLASAGLAPYLEGPTVSGSLPNKSFEYMSAGLPILSCHSGDLEMLIQTEQIGLQYQAGQVDSLVEKIRWLAANPAARKDRGRRARRLFEERFSAEVIYPQLVTHLERVAQGGVREE